MYTYSCENIPEYVCMDRYAWTFESIRRPEGSKHIHADLDHGVGQVIDKVLGIPRALALRQLAGLTVGVVAQIVKGKFALKLHGLACMRASIYIHIYVYTHTYIDAYTHIHTHTHTHTHTQSSCTMASVEDVCIYVWYVYLYGYVQMYIVHIHIDTYTSICICLPVRRPGATQTTS